MTTCLGKSCSFGLPRVPFVNCCQFMYLVISLLVLRQDMGSDCISSRSLLIFLLYLGKLSNSQQSIARKNSSDGKIEYIMASMLIVLLDVW